MNNKYEIDANEILSKLDIVDVISRYINVTKKGKNYVAICPFHNDTNPSLSISKEKQIYKCFVCGAGGNALTFISKYEKISYSDAIYKAADMLGITYKKTTNSVDPNKNLKKVLSDLYEYYSFALTTSQGKVAKDYCEKRGLNDEIIKKFKIGFAPVNGEETIKYLQSCGNSIEDINKLSISSFSNGNYYDKNAGRLIFSLTNNKNEIVGFSARKLSTDTDSPKYINSSESKIFVKSKILYNEFSAKDTAKRDGFIYIVEGFMDVIAFCKAGIESVVGLMGTAFSNETLELLKFLNVEVRLCLDGDNPGQNAMVSIVKKLEDKKVSYRIVKRISEAKDADEILARFGKEKLIEYANNLISKQEFLLNYFSSSYNLADDTEKKKFINDMIDNIQNVSNELDLDEYFQKMSKLTGFSTYSIRAVFNKAKAKIKSKTENTPNNEHFDNFDEQYSSTENKFIKYKSSNQIINNLEYELIYQMLKDEKALKFYEKNVEYFYNEIYSEICLYLVNYYKEANKVNIAGLINYINLSDDNNNKDLLVNSIIEISNSNEASHCKLNEKTLLDIKNKLDIERYYDQKFAELNKKINSEIDSKIKIDLYSERAELNKEYIKKRSK